MLKPSTRRDYLPRIAEFLKMDNERNWRFRQELADQLRMLVPLFSAQEVKDFLSPIALVLIQDKVSILSISWIFLGGGAAPPCASPPPRPSIFSDDSLLVHHPVNRDDLNLLAHAMASDFTVTWQFSQRKQFFIRIKLHALI
jgi:hypothetical protein